MQNVVEPSQIGIDDDIPIFIFHAREYVVTRDAGVQDHAVIASMVGDLAFQHIAALSAISDIEAYDPAFSAVIENFGKRRLGAFGVRAIMNGDREAVPCDPPRDRAPNSLARAGDQYRSSHDSRPVDRLLRVDRPSTGQMPFHRSPRPPCNRKQTFLRPGIRGRR